MKKEKLQDKYLNDNTKEITPETKAKIMKAFENCNIGKKTVYGLYDANMGFTQVFIENNDGLVCRNIMQAIKTAKAQNQPTPLSDFPDCFSVWKVCEIQEDGNTVNIHKKVIEVKDLINMYD